MYKRVLLKVSGEQLAGKYEHGIDPELCSWLAGEIKKVTKETGTQVVIMVGGGNLVRGADIAGHGVQRVTADHMGMLATMINALALTDIFESEGITTRCLSSIFADQVAEPFVYRLAEKHLDKGRVVIAAGGIGRPYITTDTAAVSLALELGCELVMKATKYNGVFDSDPAKSASAKKYDTLSFQQAIENPEIKVMDKAALGMAMDYNLTTVIFDTMKAGNILGVVQGKAIGTKVS
jgi:uridylate kinase